MRRSKITFTAMAIALLLVANVAGLAQAQGGTNTSTAFVLQNLGSNQAVVNVEFRDTSGTVTKNYNNIPIDGGKGYNMDQRFESGDPGSASFQGSVIASSSEQLGSVVNVMRTGAVQSFESYNGLGDATVGKSVRAPQILKGVASAGVQWNTTIAIQNTDTTQGTSVTVTFTPDPVTNAAIGGTVTSPVAKTYTLGAGATLVLDQSTQTDPNIGTKFFGSALVESTVTNVGVVTTSDGGGNVLLAYPSYAAGSTTPIGLPSVFKNIASLGNSYSTAFLLVNFGGQPATVEIEYIPANASYTVSGKDTVTIPANGSKNVDQRYDAPSITSATFMGAAIVTPVAGTGTVQPVAVMVNMRGDSRYGMTYGGLTSGVAAGNSLYLPVGYKNLTSAAQGLTWSSTIVFQAFAANSTVTITYNDSRTGMASWTSAVIPVSTGTQVDLRFSDTTAGHDTFFGSIVVNVTAGQVGAMVQTRGSGGSGDALMAYQGLSK